MTVRNFVPAAALRQEAWREETVLSRTTRSFLQYSAIYFPYCFFIPLLNEKRSDFATFHSNQNLVVLISYVICGIIPIVGWVASVFVFVCVVLGIISAAKGETKEMPLLGRIRIIK